MLAGIILATLPSCKAVSSFIHDGEVVAKYGKHKLFLSELQDFIPDGTSPGDSASLADQYIISWAKDKAFQDMAEESLSKEEKDVKAELEAYRKSLLRYRFEQHFIDERLDTVVSDAQAEAYYESHKDNFKLDRPVLRARFMSIPKSSPNLKTLKALMSSDDSLSLAAADSIAFASAHRYRDYSRGWIDAATLAAEFGTDYVTMLSSMRGGFIEIPSGDDLSVAYVVEMAKAGQTAPLGSCMGRIRDNILSSRKHELLSTLEQDLIEDAKANEIFVTYRND